MIATPSFPERLPKASDSFDRSVPLATTLALIPELRKRYNITRVAETTFLDRTGIPTYSAHVPCSPDLLGVYNGKGLTHEAALASAVMEASERQIGANVQLPTFRASVRSVCDELDLDALGLLPEARDIEATCVHGVDLLTGDTIAVPLAMVQCPWRNGEKLFRITSTNGLASGNNLTEAAYHALCELVERHAWSLFHVRSTYAPAAFKNTQKQFAIAPEVILPTGDAVVDDLVERMHRADLKVRAFCLQDGELPTTMAVALWEPDSTPPMVHLGMGCALSPTHALIRGLTEAAQSRVTDIQAAREDILRPDEDAGKNLEHGRRPKTLPTNEWYFDLPAPAVQLAQISGAVSNDLARDLQTVVRAIAASGVERIVIVDISPEDLPISVVRAIAPGLETLMYSGVLGPRARAWLNPFAV